MRLERIIMFYVYFIESGKNGKIYVGVTEKDPTTRVNEHNSNSNSWSKNNRPFVLKYFEKYFCKVDALTREKFYKSGFGMQIKKIIIENANKWTRSSDG